MSSVIPKGVVEQMGLEPGDYLDWDIRGVGREKSVLVRKVGGP